MTEATDFKAIFAAADAVNAADPHGWTITQRQHPLGTEHDPNRTAIVTCNCGRVFEARTDGIAFAAYERHARSAR